MTTKERLKSFRKETANICSSAGLVYSLETGLIFSNLYKKCITFNWEYLKRFRTKEQRRRFRFRQVATVPILIGGRKLGVLHLLNERGRFFYPRDHIYDLLGFTLGAALLVGQKNDALRPEIANALEDALQMSSQAELKPIRRFFSAASYRFLPVEPIDPEEEIQEVGPPAVEDPVEKARGVRPPHR